MLPCSSRSSRYFLNLSQPPIVLCKSLAHYHYHCLSLSWQSLLWINVCVLNRCVVQILFLATPHYSPFSGILASWRQFLIFYHIAIFGYYHVLTSDSKFSIAILPDSVFEVIFSSIKCIKSRSHVTTCIQHIKHSLGATVRLRRRPPHNWIGLIFNYTDIKVWSR